MRPSAIASLVLLSSAVLPAARAQVQENTQAAVQAEIEWVHLLDAGDYAAAWASAAKVMQTALPEQDFTKQMSGTRKPLGALSERTLKQAQERTQLPGVPDGHYVVAQYTTRFANKAEAIETVIASRAPDGSWHVAGYFIR